MRTKVEREKPQTVAADCEPPARHGTAAFRKQCANRFSKQGAADVARFVHREDEHRHVVCLAQRKRLRVHHAETLLKCLRVTERLVAAGVGMLERVAVINAVHLCRLENRVRLNLVCAQRGGVIGGAIRIAGAGDKNNRAPLFKVAHGTPLNERLGNLVHRNGCLDARRDAVFFETVHDCQPVDDSGEHAHVVTGGAVGAVVPRARETAKDVSTANDNGDLRAKMEQFAQLNGEARKDAGVNRIAVVGIFQRFAA